jgi:DNA-binding transcriptional regulator GbsR (MarR family)
MMPGMADTAAVRAAFVQLWGSMGPFWGVPPTTARVYGWLISKKESATADEIVEGLGMSRGAVSMACRELRDWGLVHHERESGSRQASYRPETDLEKAIRNIVQARKRREWDPILSHLREWIPVLEAERSSEAQVFRERLKAIEALVGMADAMAESFLKGGMVHRLGLKVLVAAASKKRDKQDKRKDKS